MADRTEDFPPPPKSVSVFNHAGLLPRRHAYSTEICTPMGLSSAVSHTSGYTTRSSQVLLSVRLSCGQAPQRGKQVFQWLLAAQVTESSFSEALDDLALKLGAQT